MNQADAETGLSRQAPQTPFSATSFSFEIDEAKLEKSYLKKIMHFIKKNKKFTITNHYESEIPQSCEVCGNYPIKDIYIITNPKGEDFRVGNVCINKITNRKITQLVKKQERIEANQKYLDYIQMLIKAWYAQTPIAREIMSFSDIKRITQMRTRIKNGYNLTTSQDEFLESIDKEVKKRK